MPRGDGSWQVERRLLSGESDGLEKNDTYYLSEDRIDRGMRQWEAESPGIDCSGKAIVGRILYLQQLLSARINLNLARFGLKFPAYAVLATIRVSGPPYRMTPSEILSSIVLSSGGLSNLLRKLEKDGYVQRQVDTRDGRGVIVQLTQKGIALTDKTMSVHAELEREIVAALTPEEQSDTARLLRKLIATNRSA